jgi:hypothetical protein
MAEADPFDWTPEIDLVKGLVLPARVRVFLDYFDAARKRASARSQVFVHTVIEDSGLDGEDLTARLRDDAEFAALFEGALEAGMRSAHDQKVQLLARVVAQAANDTANVNDAELVASTIRELQPPHVQALTILADHKLQHPDASGAAAVIEGMAGLRTRGPGKATGSAQILRAVMGVADDVADPSPRRWSDRDSSGTIPRLRRLGDHRLRLADPELAAEYQGRPLIGKQHSLTRFRPAHQGTTRPTGRPVAPAAALSSTPPRAILGSGGRWSVKIRAAPSAANAGVAHPIVRAAWSCQLA